MLETFPLWSYLLWFCNFVLEILIVVRWTRRRTPRLILLPVFVGFIALSDVVRAVALAIAPASYAYWYLYWWSVAIQTLLRALLAIQIMTDLLHEYRFRILLWSLYASFVVILISALGLPTGASRVFIRMVVAGDLCAAIILAVAICWPSLGWPKGYTPTAFGLLFALSAEIVSYLVRFKTGLAHLTALRMALPLAGIVTMVIFLVAIGAGNSFQTGSKTGNGDQRDQK